jgi:hypothetical protein
MVSTLDAFIAGLIVGGVAVGLVTTEVGKETLKLGGRTAKYAGSQLKQKYLQAISEVP